MVIRRKRRKAINEPGHAHFLTFSSSHRWPLLSKDRSRQWVIDSLANAREKLQFSIWAYVIMPQHVHALILPKSPEYTVSHMLAAIKLPVSKLAKAYLQSTGFDHWITRLTVREGNRTKFRFWQAGGGYDSNLWRDRTIEKVIDYIHANPVRGGLVQRPTDWYWSSAAAHAGLKTGRLAVDSVDLW